MSVPAWKTVSAVALVLLGLASATAQAATPAYLGRWVITSAQPAPWFDPKNPATAPFDDHLIGRVVIYRPTRIDAPRPPRPRPSASARRRSAPSPPAAPH